jgi:hypothetical protein
VIVDPESVFVGAGAKPWSGAEELNEDPVSSKLPDLCF